MENIQLYQKEKGSKNVPYVQRLITEPELNVSVDVKTSGIKLLPDASENNFKSRKLFYQLLDLIVCLFCVTFYVFA